MRSTTLGIAALFLVLRVPAAETGDFDGDGRIALADVVHLLDQRDPASGSADAALTTHFCDSGENARTRFAGAVYLEALRRGSGSTVPHWVRLWQGPAAQPPLAGDPAVIVTELRAVAAGGQSDRALVSVSLHVLEPVRAFALVIESPSQLLRPVFTALTAPDALGWPRTRWTELHGAAGYDGNGWRRPDEVFLAAGPAGFLITGGHYVLSFGLRKRQVLEPGEHVFTIEARVPLGAKAGELELQLSSASEAALASGRAARVLAAGSGLLSIEDDVAAGWDEGLPPLFPDAETGAVGGRVEFRVVDANGDAPELGQPVATVEPGGSIDLKVQLRTEVPLNEVAFDVRWGSPDLTCAANPVSLFPDRESGTIYPLAPSFPQCVGGPGVVLGRSIEYLLMAGADATALPFTRYPHPDRALEYFKPLGEWVDVASLPLRVPAAAATQDVAMTFHLPHEIVPTLPFTRPLGFVPYSIFPHCNNWRDHLPAGPKDYYWRYDISGEATFIRIQRQGDPPPPPPDLDIRLSLGSVAALPGEVAELPLFASTAESLMLLRAVYEVVGAGASLDGINVEVDSTLTGVTRTVEAAPGVPLGTNECIDNDLDGRADECKFGQPLLIHWKPSDPRFAVLDLNLTRVQTAAGNYLSTEPRQVAALRLRIAPDAPAGQVLVRPASIRLEVGGVSIDHESGGVAVFGPGASTFSPAAHAGEGAVHVGGKRFLRSDSNGDAQVDLSDAVFVLLYLFSGGPTPECLDAADADDSGAVEITDAIYLLGALFLGTRTIPPPFPACGNDAAVDALGCQEGCS